MDQQPAYEVFPILCCGVDWLTCTAKARGVQSELEDWAVAQMTKQMPDAGQVRQAFRLGFKGHRTNSMFVGRRPGEVMVQLSGPSCTPLVAEAITRSSNVSRIDLQVTVWTEGERPHLGRWTYEKMCGRIGGTGRPRKLGLIEGWPDGQTLTVGSRASASYGRLYDKAAESKVGLSRLLWRYEVEWKGKSALRQARRVVALGGSPSVLTGDVHSWFSSRGPRPAFAPLDPTLTVEPCTIGGTRSTLDWFRSSVAVTVARCINEFGAEATIAALGLTTLFNGGQSNGRAGTGAASLPGNTTMDLARAELPERFLFHQQGAATGHPNGPE